MGQYKNPENPRSNFSPIVGNFQLFPGKILLFPKNPNFSRKNDLSSAKISDDLFLVINSKFQILRLIFSKNTTLSKKIYRYSFLTIPYFSAKP